MQQRHLDDEGKQVINDGVEELVRHLPPGQVCHTLQLVVEVQLQKQLSHTGTMMFGDSHPSSCLPFEMHLTATHPVRGNCNVIMACTAAWPAERYMLLWCLQHIAWTENYEYNQRHGWLNTAQHAAVDG